MLKIGLDVARSDTATSVRKAREVQESIGGDLPVIIRPSFTLGGTGSGVAHQEHEFEEVVYEKRGRKNKVKKFKTDEMRGRGRKPKKFRDYNKTKSNKLQFRHPT